MVFGFIKQSGGHLKIYSGEGIGTTVKLFLTGLGYGVIEVEDGTSAIDVLQGGARVDLLFTDVVLPNAMSGPEIVSAARSIRPGIKALYMSGYTSQSVISAADVEGVQLLTKPFLRRDLARRVRYVLDVDTV